MDNYIERLRKADNEHYQVPRINLVDRENPMEVYEEVDFIERHLLKKETILELMELLFDEGDIPVTDRGCPVPSLYQLLSALRYFTTGSFQIVCGDLHQLSQLSVSRIIKKMARNIESLLTFNRNQDIVQQRQRGFYEIASMPGIVGAIDCTHVPFNCRVVKQQSCIVTEKVTFQ